MKKSPTGAAKKPPPTPQRNSSIKADSSAEYLEARARLENLVSRPGSTSGPSGPPAPPKPGKLNLGHLPPALQAKVGKVVGDFPSPPPPESDYPFPPPPLDNDLPPPPPLPADLLGNASRVAVVNPQPQSQSSTGGNIWSAGRASLKKTPPPTVARRSNGTASIPTAMEVHRPATSPPTSPKGQPNFLEDLHRTLRRKSGSRQGSLSSGGGGDPAAVTATMDDMALPPPPPELLEQGNGTANGGGGYSSGNISGYATLRRGPPPAPPKRDNGTKLTN